MMQSGVLVFVLYFESNKTISGHLSKIDKKFPR